MSDPCPNCGEPVAAGDAFCEACGHSLAGEAAGSVPVGPAPAETAPVAPAPAETKAGPSPSSPPPVTTAAGPEPDVNVMARGLAAAAVARATARSVASSAAAAGAADRHAGAEAEARPGAAGVPASAGTTAGVGPPDAGSEGVPCRSCGTTGQWFDGYCGVCGARRPDPRDHTEVDRPGVAAVSDKGLRHAKNEDSYAVGVGDGFVVAIVCDGVSTTVTPEVASQAAADAAAAVLLGSGAATPDFDGAFDAARAAVLAVEFEPHPSLGPPACTYLAAVITDSAYRLSAYGDCRGYWVEPDGTVQQLTTDDSWASHQIALGMAPADAYADNRAHAITRWLARDADPSWRPASIEFSPPGPGRALLVSDGVWNYAAESPQLTEVLRQAPPSALDVARHLVLHANGKGGADNITAVVVDLPLQPGNPEAP